MLVAGQHLGAIGHQAVGVPERMTAQPGHRHRLRQRVRFVVPGSRRRTQRARHHLGAQHRLLVGHARARRPDQVAAGFDVAVQQVQIGVVDHVERHRDQHRPAPHQFGRIIGARVPQLNGRDDVASQTGVEQAAVEQAERLLVGELVTGPALHRSVEGRLCFDTPAGFGGDHQAHLADRLQAGQQLGVGRQFGAHLGEFGVGASGLQAVRQDALPPGLGAVAVGVPMPVLDQLGAAGQQLPDHLPALAGPGHHPVRAAADGGGVGLGHQEGRLLHAAGDVGQVLHVGGPRPRDPEGRAQRVEVVDPGQGEPVLGGVVDVRAGDVQRLADHGHVLAGLIRGDAGGDPVVRRHQRAHQFGLPTDVVVAHLGLVAPPGQVVGRGGVAFRGPQLVPVGEPVRPVGEPPAQVQLVNGAVALPAPVDEAGEDVGVVDQRQARLVVHLPAHHRRVVGVASDDRPDHALGEPPESGVGVVHVLAHAVRLGGAGGHVQRRLGVGLAQPRRHGVGRGSDHHVDPAGERRVQHRSQPVEVELALGRLPGGPHRLPHPDQVEAAGHHQVEVRLQPWAEVVLVVIGGPEPDPVEAHRWMSWPV